MARQFLGFGPGQGHAGLSWYFARADFRGFLPDQGAFFFANFSPKFIFPKIENQNLPELAHISAANNKKLQTMLSIYK